MKTRLFFSIVVLLTINVRAQFIKTTISNVQTDGVYGLLEFDFDGDGDWDLMSASQQDNTLAYYINDGNGNFTQTIITNDLSGASFIDAADFGDDGDMDFIGLGTSELYWYENNNGTFTEHLIASGLSNPLQCRVYDIGSVTDPTTPDGDIDVGLLISGENYATLYMNDGANNFSRLNIISVNSPKYLNGGDFDADGVDDFLISSYNNNEVLWYKLGAWGFVLGGVVTSGFEGAYGVEGGDIDLDGDDDVIATAFLGNEVAWFENDGSANFTKHLIDDNLPGASYIRWMDIDNDGDKDIIATGYGNESGGATTGHQVVIYYNDGNQDFIKTVVDDTEQGPATFSIQDFNNDSALDIAFAANVSDEIILLSQQTGGILDNAGVDDFNVYPNPATSFINIQTKRNKIDYIDMVDITGRKVLSTVQTKIPVGKFIPGYYLLQVHFSTGDVSVRKVLIK